MNQEIELSQATDTMHSLVDNVSRVLVGKRNVIRNLVLALCTGSHVLVEDVPGVGKTTLVKALVRSTDLSFRRIQFTPDLLPADITGTMVINPETSDFCFRRGPIFHNVILADEINRASPKTQSSLLESMEEGQVTVEGRSHPLPQPFLVMATQNPIEYEGTFPLPEAQLDRFALSVQMGYPSADQERKMLRRFSSDDPLLRLKPQATSEQIEVVKKAVDRIFVSDAVMQYIIKLVSATRQKDSIYLGASPRASLSLLKLSQALALYRGMQHVLPDHIKKLTPNVLQHRLILTPDARWDDRSPLMVLGEILSEVSVPGIDR